MSAESFSAWLPGAFALGGAVVTGGLALAGFWLKARQDLRSAFLTRHFERKLQVYEQAFDCAAAIYQTASKTPDLEDIRRINRDLILVGSPKVLRSWSRIGDTSAEKLRRAGLDEEHIRDAQTKVAKEFFSAVREDLYPGLPRLRAEDIRFIEPKQL
jgi:hypothetical protein